MLLIPDRPFDEFKTAAQNMGGKARGLMELRAAGFPVPEFVISPADVAQAVTQLGLPLVVRSSASLEDGTAASFAGQFQSFLNLRSVDQVVRAIEACHASLNCPAVEQYCRRTGMPSGKLKMQVILQRMIEPELAGVAFSVNPVTGAEQVVIEACPGLAEDLLAGRSTPLPTDDPRVRVHQAQIEQTVLAIQAHYGTPQDVEFAIEAGQLYVLQARPITRIAFAGEPGEWTNADFRDGGVSSRVCTPLMASLYELVWDQALKRTLRELHLLDRDFTASRQFFGRPYWNVGEVKRCVAKLPGYCEREFDQDVQIRITYEGNGQRTPLSVTGIVRAVPTVMAVRRFLKQQQQAARALLANHATAAEHPPHSQETSPDAFGSMVHEQYLPVETTYFRTIFAASLAKMDFLSSFPEATDRSLLAGLPPLRHLAPLREVRRLPDRSTKRLEAIIARYCHHCRLGLDICLPRWDEDREFVLPMLRDLPNVDPREPRALYEQSLAAALSKIAPWRRARFRRKLARLRHLIWLREELRDVSNIYYYRLRQMALDIARMRNLGDDIFMMPFQQLVADDRSAIPRNRQRHASYRHFRPPNEIGDRYRHHSVPRDAILRGVGASGGMARGRVYVARDVGEASRMAAGRVLVCPFTDPGWTPVLERAAAVVTETGGLLSHAAVICREFGIPAVLGVDAATRTLRAGQEVVVWGDKGVVETNVEVA